MQKSAPSLTLHLKPSRSEAVLLITVHLLALCAAWCNALVVVLKIGLSLTILGHLVGYLRRYRRPRVPLTLRYDCDYGWQLAHGDEAFATICLDGQSVLTPWLTLLLYRDAQGRCYRVLLFADAFSDPGAHRRLRVMLKIHSHRP